MIIELKLNVQYNTDELRHAGICGDELIRDELEAVLTRGIERLVGEGGLTGDTMATVDEWEVHLSDGGHFSSGGKYADVDPANL